MPRKATGTTFQDRSGRWYARVTLGAGAKDRPAFALPEGFRAPAAEARKEVLASLAARLRAGSVPRDIAEGLLERAAAAEGPRLAHVLAAAERILAGEVPIARGMGKDATFREIGEAWTSGELARLYPDHVPTKHTPKNDAGALGRHVYPIVGDVPIVAFTLDHAQAVLRSLPGDLEVSTRRRIGKTIARVLSLAAFPLRMIAASPLPRAWLPRSAEGKAKGYLYPDEDRVFLAACTVPLGWRVLVGFLHREGPRWQEAARFTWSDVDLARGAITLDENKTNDPRTWTLDPGVARALTTWKGYRARTAGKATVEPSAPVFVNSIGRPFTRSRTAAAKLRTFLLRAGIERAQLHEKTKTRRRIRAHDTRAGFITIALAHGRSETWVADRTGHKSSLQINGYHRQARTAAELNLGQWTPLDLAIPELAGGARGNGSGNGSKTETGNGNDAIRAAFIASTAHLPLGRDAVPVEHPTTPSPLETTGVPRGVVAPIAPLSRCADESPAVSTPAPTTPESPRAALLATLFESARTAALAGDLAMARIAHEAIGKLLATEVAPVIAPIVDLAEERRRRER